VRNTNESQVLSGISISDDLPKCIRFLSPLKITFDPPGCAADLLYSVDTTAGTVGINGNLPDNTLPAGFDCTLTFGIEAVQSGPCINTTPLALSAESAGVPAEDANTIRAPPSFTWNYANSSMQAGGAWVGGIAPGTDADTIYPPGAGQLTVDNDLPG